MEAARVRMNLLVDSSFLYEKARRNVTEEDIAAVLDDAEVFTYTSRCVMHNLKHKLQAAKSKAKENEIAAQLALTQLVELTKCRLHKKETKSVASCLEAIIRFETDVQRGDDNPAWSAGSCIAGVQNRVHLARPNVPILTVDKAGVRRVY